MNMMATFCLCQLSIMWQSSASVLGDVPLVMKVVTGHSELHCPHCFSSSSLWGFTACLTPHLCHPHSQTSGSVLRHRDNNLQRGIFLLLASLSFSWWMAAWRWCVPHLNETTAFPVSVQWRVSCHLPCCLVVRLRYFVKIFQLGMLQIVAANNLVLGFWVFRPQHWQNEACDLGCCCCRGTSYGSSHIGLTSRVV